MALLYKLSGRPTGRQIGSGLGLRYGTAFFFRKNPLSITIRWGGAEWEEYETENCLNKANAIRAASHKVGTLRRLDEAGIGVPRFTTSPSVAREWGTTCFGRSAQGFGGRGITIYREGDRIAPGHDFYSEYVPNQREYRLHVVRGEVVSVQRKYCEREWLKGDGFIKNHNHGYVFKTPEKTLNKSRSEAAIAAVEILGLDFGAVDLVIDNEGKEYVLEVNTAPALSPLRVDQYLQSLRPLLKT